MAERRNAFLREAWDHLLNNMTLRVQLKPEQRKAAVEYQLNKDDMLAVLPTGRTWQKIATAGCSRVCGPGSRSKGLRNLAL